MLFEPHTISSGQATRFGHRVSREGEYWLVSQCELGWGVVECPRALLLLTYGPCFYWKVYSGVKVSPQRGPVGV